MMRPAIALCCLAMGLVGCTTTNKSLYAWGHYEDLIYVAGTKPGSVSPEAQTDQLEKDRALADAARRPLPPGWRMHLASLYAESGRADLAERELLAEKQAFPESATLVDRLLANLRRTAP